MKPAAFRYFAPRTLDEVLELLAEHGEDAKVLAGGQSLVPAMNFRLARPELLIDINRVAALDYVREEEDALCIGAPTITRWPCVPHVCVSRMAMSSRRVSGWAALPIGRSASPRPSSRLLPAMPERISAARPRTSPPKRSSRWRMSRPAPRFVATWFGRWSSVR